MLANATQAKCIIVQIPSLSDRVPSLLEHSRLGFLPRKGSHWALLPARPCYGPAEWPHWAPWTMSFLWLGPLATAFSTLTFPSSETGSWPWAHSLGTLCRGHSVLKNGWLSAWQPPVPFSGHRRSGNVRPESVSLSQNSFAGIGPSSRGIVLM